MLYQDKATPAEYSAGLKYAMDHKWLERHESGTYVKILPAGNDLGLTQINAALGLTMPAWPIVATTGLQLQTTFGSR